MSCEWDRKGSSPISEQSCMFTSGIDSIDFQILWRTDMIRP